MRRLLQALRATYFWLRRLGLTGFVNAVVKRLRTGGVHNVMRLAKIQMARFEDESVAYKAWLKRNVLTEPMLEGKRQHCASFPDKPVFSIVMPVGRVHDEWLPRALESVKAQVYPHWELCVTADASIEPHIRLLLERRAATDSRIKVTHLEGGGHISIPTNEALAAATGDYICLMDHDDEIAPEALYEFASVINAKGRVGMIYSDEDKLSGAGERHEPFFKPDWSPEYLETCFYTAHLSCYRADIARRLGGFRSGYEGAQHYDFVLRFVDQRPQIVHLKQVLYHRRSIDGGAGNFMPEKDYVPEAACRALRDHLVRTGAGGSAVAGVHAGSFEVRQEIRGKPLVSIVIPSAGKNAVVRGRPLDLLANCVESIRDRTSYSNYEIVVVDNDDLRAETLAHVRNAGCRLVHFKEPFNVARKMNLGAKEATGDYLVFLNDDIEVIESAWLENMLQLTQRPEIGVVGAKLLFDDGTLQHVGVVFNEDGLPYHIHRSRPGNFPGYYFNCVGTCNYLAVTGACLMTRTEVFRRLEGFDEGFPVSYNDIDYCLRAVKADLRVVLCPGAKLYHFESKTHERMLEQQAVDRFQRRWSTLTKSDPFYGRMLDRKPPTAGLVVT